ncbi:MAG: hypothetical protein JXQ79_03255 [Rhodobacteraceae bacterium]|nr:hypothetical protein [Paracoccaceae bacterium]
MPDVSDVSLDELRLFRSAFGRALIERAELIPFFERIDSDFQEREMAEAGDFAALARKHIEDLKAKGPSRGIV